MMRWLFAILVGLVLAGLVHILTLLAIPSLAPSDAYTRLGAAGPDNAFHLLAPAGDDAAILPGLDPAFLHAACRFDLTRGPLRVRVPARNSFLALSFYTREGVAFFSVNERSAVRGALDLVLSEAGTADADTGPQRGNAVTAPGPAGFILVRALVPMPSEKDEIRNTLRGARCEPAGATVPSRVR